MILINDKGAKLDARSQDDIDRLKKAGWKEEGAVEDKPKLNKPAATPKKVSSPAK
tara:strand:- start:208 stop:372 length:165 start_codon:yes stop_codon:yes gene_type:complete